MDTEKEPAGAREDRDLEPEACLQAGSPREGRTNLEGKRVDQQIEPRLSNLEPLRPACEKQRAELDSCREYAARFGVRTNERTILVRNEEPSGGEIPEARVGRDAWATRPERR